MFVPLSGLISRPSIATVIDNALTQFIIFFVIFLRFPLFLIYVGYFHFLLVLCLNACCLLTLLAM